MKDLPGVVDFAGQRVYVGDQIYYVSTSSHNIYPRIATIISFTEMGFPRVDVDMRTPRDRGFSNVIVKTAFIKYTPAS